MHKEYYISRYSLWFIAKILIYIGMVVYFLKYIYVILIIDFLANWLLNGHGPFEFVKSYWQGIQDILFNKGGVRFVIGIYEENVKTKDGDFLYPYIKLYEISRGGSEPYLILINGKRVDLNISWLKKSEQLEIEAYLQNRINGKRA
ncbi:hypothetical protein [uncultured Dokdonia sp.]|uniref:hypothetical protein n=1 Tax=uncultured Dokdonia sp. TaxID=575653 RepID=UPI002628CC21|nr:hypothetical protein [uncultured Dokdonia sp.]